MTCQFYFFYSKNNPLSNWADFGFTINSQYFPNGETYLMYCKARLHDDRITAGKILESGDPAQVKRLGRRVMGYDEELWSSRRLQLMAKGARAKANQNLEVANLLLANKGKIFVEASPHDKIWGIGLDERDPRSVDPSQWLGQNLLGQAWTIVARELSSFDEISF